MTTAAPSPIRQQTRAEIRQERRPRRTRGGTRARANRALAVVAVLLVVVATTLGVVAYLTYDAAVDTRAVTKPLETRAARLQVDLTTADTAIDRFTALFAAVRAQSDATTKAVDAANQAAQQYNTAQSGIAAAIGGDAANTGAALAQSTAAVQTAVDDVSAAVSKLVHVATGGPNG